PHSFTATATDALGNVSAASGAFAITVDTTPPGPPIIATTNGEVVAGTAEPGASVRLDRDDNGSIDATVDVGDDGNWAYTPPVALPDDVTVRATVVDAAGNVSPDATVIVDVALPPPPPLIIEIGDDVGEIT